MGEGSVFGDWILRDPIVLASAQMRGIDQKTPGSGSSQA